MIGLLSVKSGRPWGQAVPTRSLNQKPCHLGEFRFSSPKVQLDPVFGSWTFLDGELRSLNADSVSFKGHCVMTDLTLNLVGQSAGPKTIKIRAAFTVFKDGAVGLIGTN